MKNGPEYKRYRYYCFLVPKFHSSHACKHLQWRIQDFPQGGAPTPKSAIIFQFFAENCMKMKEFGPPGGGARPWRPPLDPPMIWATHFKKYSEILFSLRIFLNYVFKFLKLTKTKNNDVDLQYGKEIQAFSPNTERWLWYWRILQKVLTFTIRTVPEICGKDTAFVWKCANLEIA